MQLSSCSVGPVLLEEEGTADALPAAVFAPTIIVVERRSIYDEIRYKLRCKERKAIDELID